MCMIIDNTTNADVRQWFIDWCFRKNPDGFSYINMNTGNLIRTMNPRTMRKALRRGDPYIAHWRKATIGEADKNGIHLFPINNNWHLMMNGTIWGYRYPVDNDAKRTAEILRTIPQENWEQYLDNFEARFLLVNSKTLEVIKTGNWVDIESNGINIQISKPIYYHRKKKDDPIRKMLKL